MSDFPQIVGVGHNCLDYLCTVEAYPPEDGSTHITSIAEQGGGAAATAVVAAVRLGLRGAFVGKLGDDDTGKKILALLQKDNVDTSYIDIVPGGRSSVSYLMVNPANASRTKFPYPDELAPIEWDERLAKLVGRADALHIDGTKYDNAFSAVRIAKEAGVTVSLDGCSMQRDNEKNKALASLVDILIMNARYPLLVSGIADYARALLEMSHRGPKIVIGTQGSSGCMAVIGGSVFRFPAYTVAAVDTTGAGDVFHGAFLAGYFKGMDLETNIKFASAVSALKCMKVGGRDGIPSYEDALSFMNARTIEKTLVL
ncbi:carbohydrate kinase family protein [Treponema socranskii]|uniref:carbohydrate kinase family protein n=1 Tax=Treponema socranskii TaxID=53419 RepID=UPI003D910BE9